MKKHKKVLLALACLALVLAAVASFLVLGNRGLYEDTASISKKAGFSVVLPSKLPSDGTVLKQPVYEQDTNVVTTSIMLNGKAVVFTQQKRPNIDLKQIDSQDSFLVNAGPVYVLKGEPERLQAIIESSDSWIMVNADESLGIDQFKDLLNSLSKV